MRTFDDSLAALASVLQAHAPKLAGDERVRLSDVCQDSRDVRPGALFVVRAGDRAHGARFVAAAERAGAVALLGQRGDGEFARLLSPLPKLCVDDLELALARAAHWVHGEPSRKLRVIGITGTNGKTTTAALVRQCLEQYGYRCASIGTLGYQFGEQCLSIGMTTPMADSVARWLARAAASGATHCVMEVSSHALAQRRVDGVQFDVAAFCNLTRDHLDFHQTEQRYAEAKARLFEEFRPPTAVVNLDDEFGRQLAARLESDAEGTTNAVETMDPVKTTMRVIGVGSAVGAQVRCLELASSRRGMRLAVNVCGDQLRFETTLVGGHNADNWLLTIGILAGLGLSTASLPAWSRHILAAPGRLSRCERDGDDISVLVDYAHTPDALERVLVACRELRPRRLICVFGCGGDRDATKRPLMGEDAGRLADESVLTNDNPRSEPPERIVAEIEVGVVQAGGAFQVCLDRAEAITQAIVRALPGDLVLIAGKGHEDYQIIGDQRFEFDDRQVAHQALVQRRAAPGAL